MSEGRDRSRRVISYDDAVTAGVRLFRGTGGLAMESLADELSVSRATLYRVAPGRDQLLGDVLWRFGAAFHRDAVASAAGSGPDRVLAVFRHFGLALLEAAPFRRFLADEPETATRVLFTPAGRVHERFVAANAEVLRQEVESGALTLRFQLDSLAYVLSRVYESMWYADLLSGREPDLDVAEEAARAILTVPSEVSSDR